MDKQGLIQRVREITNGTKGDSETYTNAVLQAIEEGLIEDEIVKIHNFGNFEIRKRAERKGRNPQSGEEILLPETRTPAFKPGKNLKELVKK